MRFTLFIHLLPALLLATSSLQAQTLQPQTPQPQTLQPQTLEQSFATPPNSAKPYTWWHWVDGNVSKEGITKDLEAMKAVGLGGFQHFDVGLNVPPGKVLYNSKKFHELFQFAIAESERLELDAGFNNCSGWSSSGGPWIKPENSMKALVWSETHVKSSEGPSVSLSVPIFSPERTSNGKIKKQTDFYQDIAVLAFPKSTANAYRLENWKDKTLYNLGAKPDGFIPTRKSAPAGAIIDSASVMNLTDKMTASGELNWVSPAGEWTIVRFGYTSTGAANKPGSRGAIGLEVDKLSRTAVDKHWDALVEKMIVSGGGRSALTTVLIDSYEVGTQNWTDDFAAQFKQRRGYDLTPLLLCMTGRIVGSATTTERVLWDVRTTVAELMHENYFEYFAEKCHQHGMKLAIEPYGSGSFDAPATSLIADIPMTEFWQNEVRNLWQWTSQVVPSGAHLSGRSVVGAESFTSLTGDWTVHPGKLKKWGDKAFVAGVNRYYFHTFAHQPWNDAVRPGMSMGRFGGNFHRNNTWFMKSRAWMDYIARCQFIMQSGTYHADVLCLYGDERGFNSFLNSRERPDMQPLSGLHFDLGGMNSLDGLSVDEQGDIRVSYKGDLLDVRYKVLAIKRADLMLPSHVAKLGELADQGARIFAPKPKRSPTFQQHAQSDAELAELVTKYWDSGKIKPSKQFASAIAMLVPDCEVPQSILFNHHRLGKESYYFLSNQQDKAKDITAIFRVSGKQPELWDPMTGQIIDAPRWKTLPDGRTEVRLNMQSYDSLFVVFRNATTSVGQTVAARNWKSVISLNDDWTVNFDPDWGTQQKTQFVQLSPWNANDNDEIKYFSGTATYRKTFHLTQTEGTLMLDLGDVGVMARVTLNGREQRTLWKSPFRVDVTNAAKVGRNDLEVEVTNLWVNRLIGDARFGKADKTARWLAAGESPPADAVRKTIVVHGYQKRDDSLLPSGLIGPVTLLQNSK